MNYLTACQTLSWPSRSLSNRACLGYDREMTASTRECGYLAWQREQIRQAIPQRTMGGFYRFISLSVAACIQDRGGSSPYCNHCFQSMK
ncbi:hypothetical protein TNCV_2800841 [Trichonephila clavipes]|nr:hypothetical protein TNCV_2800841 [Trichonephila clavipes]